MGKFQDLTGQKFGKLTVLNLHSKEQRYNSKGLKDGSIYFWLCQCECGNFIVTRSQYLKDNSTKSCGCYKKENYKPTNIKHNKTNTRLYNIYKGLKKRCYNKNQKSYKNYGGRGIIICEEWLSDFMNFYNWSMNNGYNDNLTIDRINNDGNYEPSNCRWVDMKIQANNKRNNHLFTYNGKSQTLRQWSEELNIKYYTLKGRLRNGWTTEEILTIPIKKRANANT